MAAKIGVGFCCSSIDSSSSAFSSCVLFGFGLRVICQIVFLIAFLFIIAKNTKMPKVAITVGVIH